jgi:hypothetical protein
MQIMTKEGKIFEASVFTSIPDRADRKKEAKREIFLRRN